MVRAPARIARTWTVTTIPQGSLVAAVPTGKIRRAHVAAQARALTGRYIRMPPGHRERHDVLRHMRLNVRQRRLTGPRIVPRLRSVRKLVKAATGCSTAVVSVVGRMVAAERVPPVAAHAAVATAVVSNAQRFIDSVGK